MTDATPELLKETSVFSSDRIYRYWLHRTHTLGIVKPCLWIMLNPSIADESSDDRTTTCCARLGARWGFTHHCAVNLFAVVGTNPITIQRSSDPVGPDNDRFIELACNSTLKCRGTIVLAWGNGGTYMQRDQEVLRLLARLETPLYCLGVTKHGQPRFPRAISRGAHLLRWRNDWQVAADSGSPEKPCPPR